MGSVNEIRPELRINRQFDVDINSAETPCFAMSFVKEGKTKYASFIVRTSEPVPQTAPKIGFNFGSCNFGKSAFEVIQFSFSFQEKLFNAIINPNNKVARQVLNYLIESKHYFLLLIDGSGAVSVYKAERKNLGGTSDYLQQINASTTTERQYQKAVTSIEANVDAGIVLKWVCKSKIGYLDLSENKTIALNAVQSFIQQALPL